MFLKSSGSCRLVNMFIRSGTNRGDLLDPSQNRCWVFKSPPRSRLPSLPFSCGVSAVVALLRCPECAHSRSKGRLLMSHVHTSTAICNRREQVRTSSQSSIFLDVAGGEVTRPGFG